MPVPANCSMSAWASARLPWKTLQRQLKDAHPVLALRDLTEGVTLTPATERTAGSLEEAIALQLWNFTLEARGGFTVCKECGQIFVRKQSKARGGASRSTSLFCCDRCKNRYAQREHRKTEGYRLKQERRRVAEKQSSSH